LKDKTKNFLNNDAQVPLDSPAKDTNTKSENSGSASRFIDTVKKALISRVRSQSTADASNISTLPSSKKHLNHISLDQTDQNVSKLIFFVEV
jgi:hypothetical protein